MYIYIYVYIYVCTCIYTYKSIQTHTKTHSQTHPSTQKHTLTHTYTDTHKCTYTQTRLSHRHRQSHRHRYRQILTDRERERPRERKRKREKEREREKQREGERDGERGLTWRRPSLKGGEPSTSVTRDDADNTSKTSRTSAACSLELCSGPPTEARRGCPGIVDLTVSSALCAIILADSVSRARRDNITPMTAPVCVCVLCVCMCGGGASEWWKRGEVWLEPTQHNRIVLICHLDMLRMIAQLSPTQKTTKICITAIQVPLRFVSPNHLKICISRT